MLSLSNSTVVQVLNCLSTSRGEWRIDSLESHYEEEADTKIKAFIKENKHNPDSKDEDVQKLLLEKYIEFKSEGDDKI